MPDPGERIQSPGLSAYGLGDDAPGKPGGGDAVAREALGEIDVAAELGPNAGPGSG